jgi:hypothetical protein
MSNDGMIKLNDMLATWSSERLMIYGISLGVYPLVADQISYTIGGAGGGVGGALNALRPISITAANIITPSLSLTYALKLLTTTEYNAIRDHSATATLPTSLYNDALYPTSTLYLWPLPNSSSTQLVLYTWQQLTQFVTLADTLDFPPGYERAITYSLAVELAPEYRTQVPPEVFRIAMEAKASLKAVNAPPTHITGAGAEQIAAGQVVEGAQPTPGAPPGPMQSATS